MWIKKSDGDSICGDKVYGFWSGEGHADGKRYLFVDCVGAASEVIDAAFSGTEEEVEYIKEQLATAFIEGNRKVFDVQSELYAFRLQKEQEA